MANDNNTGFEPPKVGSIPDFFHDLLAYIIPGYTALIIFVTNLFISGLSNFQEISSLIKDLGVAWFLLSFIVAYVIGRFFEQLGFLAIQHRQPPSFHKIPSPKWSLILDDIDSTYTDTFKNNAAKKIGEWLENQKGDDLIKECRNKRKDDYFNLIQFYLRERFPSIALYEKKQNANIVLTRSLTLIFFLNIISYLLIDMRLLFNGWDAWSFSVLALLWIIVNLSFCYILYQRFRKDQMYHAMYIFESFIATKKLLESKGKDNKAS